MRARAVLLAVLLLTACARPGVAPDITASGDARTAALSGSVLFDGGAPPPLPDIDILALDAPMRAFIDRYVDRKADRYLRLHQLVYAVISEGSFGLEYTDATRTASETFHHHNGNCLSFTTLFVALARDLGLKASFQQVDIPPDWDLHGDTLVLNRHINVLIELGGGVRKAVDFNLDDFKTSYDLQKVTDHRAEAHYYSNVGVEKLQAGEPRQAFRYLRKAIAVDPGFAPAWINLGALYARNHHPAEAEASYQAALAIEPAEMVAISGLARLYAARGDTEKAARYRELARYHRNNNPFYRYQRARESFLGKDYAAALRDLDFAIARKPQQDAFHFLRGLVRLQQGDTAGARADLELAEQITTDEQLKRNYHSKMEMLLREQH